MQCNRITFPIACRRWPVRVLLIAAAALSACWGCSHETPDSDENPALPFEGVSLKLLVIGDPDLAAAARNRAGDWLARTGSTVEVLEATGPEDVIAKDDHPIAFDAVIYPEPLLGPLAEQGRLAPLSPEQLQTESLQWNRVLPLIRDHAVAWGDQVAAVPFGSRILVCFCRADLLAEINRKPPTTWDEYQEIAELLADAGKRKSPDAPFYGTMEPLGPGWAATTFLARAASLAKHPSNYSTLFHKDSMEPMINRPPFVKALEQLVQAAKSGPPRQLESAPQEVYRSFLSGRCGMALAWPDSNVVSELGSQEDEPPASMICAEVPGSREVFDLGRDEWTPREEGESIHVALLGVEGRLGSVSKDSDHPKAAFRLLVSLAGTEWGNQIRPASQATAPCREASGIASGFRKRFPNSESARQHADVLEAALSRPDWLFALRIPGRERYLNALDDAVRQAAREEVAPQAALDSVALQWQAITEELGAEDQQQAYKRSLELSRFPAK
ncbi:MAG: extracellular solute-binding protein [Planctomycetales bacterium]